jgi:transposase-like protein
MRYEAVVSSFEEGGEELFTFLQFPQLQWKALRTTNALERIKGGISSAHQDPGFFAGRGCRAVVAVRSPA